MIEDQPPPIECPAATPAWDLVIADFTEHYRTDLDDPATTHAIADMRDRDRVGRDRYGTPLTAHNGRDQLVDSYQELLDHAVYLRAWLEEHPLPPAGYSRDTQRIRTKEIRWLYKRALQNIFLLRGAIDKLASEGEVP